MKTTVRMSTNGRAQIPYSARQKLGIQDGDSLVIDILEVIHSGEAEHRKKQGVPA